MPLQILLTMFKIKACYGDREMLKRQLYIKRHTHIVSVNRKIINHKENKSIL